MDEESCFTFVFEILEILLFMDALIGPLSSYFLSNSLNEAKLV